MIESKHADDLNRSKKFWIFRAKLGVGLLSGKYSEPPSKSGGEDESRKGIPPRMFKVLIGRGHPEFFSNRQQDAQEFLLYLINLLDVSVNFFIQGFVKVTGHRFEFFIRYFVTILILENWFCLSVTIDAKCARRNVSSSKWKKDISVINLTKWNTRIVRNIFCHCQYLLKLRWTK